MTSTTLVNAINAAAIDRRVNRNGGGITSASSSSGDTTTSRTTTRGGVNELDAIKLHEERIAKRIQQLEAIIADKSLGVVSRTKAKVELALLNNDNEEGVKHSRDGEIAAIKGSNGVSKNRGMVERSVKVNEDRLANDAAIQSHLADLHRVALQQRNEAKLRMEDARIKSASAEAALKVSEMEAEEAMALAKAAMQRLNEAREHAGRERRLFEEARVDEESRIEELERLENEANGKSETKKEDGGDVRIDDVEQDQASVESTSGMSFDDELNAMKTNLEEQHGMHQRDVKYWSRKCDKMSQQVDMLESKITELQVVIKHQQVNITSLESHIEESGEKHSYSKEQSTKLSAELQDMQRRHQVQEEKLQQLKKKMDIEDLQVANLTSEIQDLEAMKQLLESKLASKTEEEKIKLQLLTREIANVISQKENALKNVEAVREFYEKSISNREKKVDELQCEINLHREELKQVQDKLQEKEVQTTNMKSSIKQIQANKLHDEMFLLQDQEHVVHELEGELERCKDEIGRLEVVNERERLAIAKMKKRAATNVSMKEAFVVADREIQRLSTSLTIEAEKADRLSFDVSHWKGSASDLSKSVCVLEHQRNELKVELDEMQQDRGILTKRVLKLQREVNTLKNDKEVQSEEAVQYKETISHLESQVKTSKETVLHLEGESQEGNTSPRSVEDESVASPPKRVSWDISTKDMLRLSCQLSE